MDSSIQTLLNRVQGAIPVSIATSLALESVFSGSQPPYDPLREIPNKIKVTDYTHFYINLLTLYRNILGSIPTKDVTSVSIADLVHTLELEVGIIKNLIISNSDSRVVPVFYASRYANLDKIYKHAKIKTDKTEKQLFATLTMEKVINQFITTQTKSDNLVLFDLDIKPSTSNQTALILTNYTYDLLAFKHFNKLDLIESHTGILKPKALWYTKFYNGKDLTNIPFNEIMLQVFGDSQTFSPMSTDVRKTVIELANTYKWTSVTTKDRIQFCINLLTNTNAETLQLLKSIF